MMSISTYKLSFPSAPITTDVIEANQEWIAKVQNLTAIFKEHINAFDKNLIKTILSDNTNAYQNNRRDKERL